MKRLRDQIDCHVRIGGYAWVDEVICWSILAEAVRAKRSMHLRTVVRQAREGILENYGRMMALYGGVQT